MIKKIINVLRPKKYLTTTVVQVAPSQLLQGKNIVITGGGRGLGFYIARKCISEGGNVLIAGRNEEVLKRAAVSLGECCKYMKLDVQSIEGFSGFWTQASKRIGGKIHCFVSNAGISLHESDFRNVTEEGWDTQMNTNLKGNYFLVKQYIEYLESLSDKSGNVVVITSERAKRADDIPYGLTKAATSSFIQCIASKVISNGIRINGVGPGVTASDMTGFDKNGNLYAENQPSKRIFMPEEVAEVVGFLLCDASACISGEIITCDQGRYISHW